MQKPQPLFLISLDFELHWGVSYRLTVEQYKKNLDGTRDGINKTLQVFNENNIHVTWATVGFLFFDNKTELLKNVPKKLPHFAHKKFSNYELLNEIGNNEEADPYHFGWNVLKNIKEYKNQEIATHTFSHLYCLEDGITANDFRQDLLTAIEVGKQKGIKIESIVFPRNQFNEEHTAICKELGIIYRSNPDGYFYKGTKTEDQNIFIKGFRFIDSFINILGHTDFSLQECNNNDVLNVKGSRFLRPFSNKFKFLENLKIKRIFAEMTNAAKNGNAYHLWWHPHNFGVHTNDNILNLQKIISHFKFLEKKYNMKSCCMNEISNYL